MFHMCSLVSILITKNIGRLYFGHLNYGKKIQCSISIFTNSMRITYDVKNTLMYKKLIYGIHLR